MLSGIVADPVLNENDGKYLQLFPSPSRSRYLQLNLRECRTFERLLARDYRRKGYVFAKVSSLAKEIGKSERTVRRGLSGLRKRGIIERDLRNPLKIWIHYPALRCLAHSRYDSCPGCGRPIRSRKSAKRRYHSTACRMRAYRARRRKRVTPVLRFLSSPTKITSIKTYNDNIPVTLSVTPQHPKLKDLYRRQGQLKRLCKAFNPDQVLRAISQADLQYGTNNGIHNAYGLIYAMCRSGFDDTLLRERERHQEQQRLRVDRERRLRELQARGCRRCGWWDVGFDGYCYECRSFKNAGISSEGGSDPPLTVFDSAAEAASRPGSSTGVPPPHSTHLSWKEVISRDPKDLWMAPGSCAHPVRAAQFRRRQVG